MKIFCFNRFAPNNKLNGLKHNLINALCNKIYKIYTAYILQREKEVIRFFINLNSKSFEMGFYGMPLKGTLNILLIKKYFMHLISAILCAYALFETHEFTKYTI